MLAPETVAAIRYGLDARLLDQAHDLDKPSLDQWLDAQPSELYAAALRCHAHLISTQNTITERSAA